LMYALCVPVVRAKHLFLVTGRTRNRKYVG
jgi:hypothetical protein